MGESEMELERLRYPVGRFQPRDALIPADRRAPIDELAALPDRLDAAVRDLTPTQLDTPYRPGGWTVRQVVNHVPDSHVNGYVRCKLAVTETDPAISVYDEAAWAELPDAREGPIEPSLALLRALHERWVAFCRALEPAELQRAFVHPELGRVSLEWTLQLYAWHGRHHLAHVTSLREREGW
jgi:uncharacterized damage-inducible protein DinB